MYKLEQKRRCSFASDSRGVVKGLTTVSKHKPDDPKGLKLQQQLHFGTLQPSNIYRKRRTEKNKHFLPLTAPSPADWAIVGSEQKTIVANKVAPNKHQIHDQPPQRGPPKADDAGDQTGQTLVWNGFVGTSRLRKEAPFSLPRSVTFR